MKLHHSEITEGGDPEFVKEVRLYFKDDVEGRNSLPIMGGTKSPTSIDLAQSTDESLFLKFQTHLISLVATSFGIDPQKMGILASMNKSTGDSLDSVTDDGAIRPVAHSIEAAINNYFLRRFGIYDVAEFKFRFTTSQNDVKALSILHQIRLQDDSMTINESRAEMGNAPMPVDKELGYSPGDMTLSEYRAYISKKYLPPVSSTPSSRPTIGDDQTTKADKGANGVAGAKGPAKDNPSAGVPMAKDVPKNT